MKHKKWMSIQSPFIQKLVLIGVCYIAMLIGPLIFTVAYAWHAHNLRADLVRESINEKVIEPLRVDKDQVSAEITTPSAGRVEGSLILHDLRSLLVERPQIAKSTKNPDESGIKNVK